MPDTTPVGLTGVSPKVESNILAVTFPSSEHPEQAGYRMVLSEVSGPSDPAGQLVRTIETTDDYVWRVGPSNMLLNCQFGGSSTSANAIQQDVWKQTATTMTATAGYTGVVTSIVGHGFLRLNSGASSAVNVGIMYQTYATYQIFGAATTYIEFEARTVNCFGAGAGRRSGGYSGSVVELGTGFATTAITWGLLDGVCFRKTALGELRGVLCFNGVEYLSKPLIMPTDNEVHRWTIALRLGRVGFWIDGQRKATIDPPGGLSNSSLQINLPVLMRVQNNYPTLFACQLDVAEVFVSKGNVGTTKPWSHIQAGMSGFCSNVPYGTAVGETNNRANATAVPATAVGTNTGATLPMTALGGLGRMTAQVTTTGAAGDMVFCSYQVPAQTALLASRRLYITGISISCSNGGAVVATTPTTLHWQLAWGHTNISLATADAVNTKAPRHLPLGQMSIPATAIVGQRYDRDIVRQFVTPVVVNPGEFIAATCRFLVGTATASQEVVANIGFEGYWE